MTIVISGRIPKTGRQMVMSEVKQTMSGIRVQVDIRTCRILHESGSYIRSQGS